MQWIVKIIIDKLFARLFLALRDWWSMRQKRKAVKEGLDENDSEKVERAMGSVNAGKLAKLDGSKVRPKRDHD